MVAQLTADGAYGALKPLGFSVGTITVLTVIVVQLVLCACSVKPVQLY